MTATELTAAKMYWHVSRSPESELKVYPAAYTPKVVGILWEMMAQFQTWFGKAPYLMYGIQQLPVTPVSEHRDDLDWAMEVYPEFAESCEGSTDCTDSGWSVLQVSMLATVGHPMLALDQALAMPVGNFDGAAGDGHSLSNTIWYIATRPDVAHPLRLSSDEEQNSGASHESPSTASDYVLTDCNQPESCTDFVLDTVAGLYTCRQRMQWLIKQRGKTQLEACATVAGLEQPVECGLCNPSGTNASTHAGPSMIHTCPPCTDEQCASDLNRCPRYQKTFVCTQGKNSGGCAGQPWDLSTSQCSNCCELTTCPPQDALHPPALDSDDLVDESDACPVCQPEVSKSRVNQCPKSGAAPFLCYDGVSVGGCSTRPWIIETRICRKCCRVPVD
jgi:hypothetical protein